MIRLLQRFLIITIAVFSIVLLNKFSMSVKVDFGLLVYIILYISIQFLIVYYLEIFLLQSVFFVKSKQWLGQFIGRTIRIIDFTGIFLLVCYIILPFIVLEYSHKGNIIQVINVLFVMVLNIRMIYIDLYRRND